MTLAPAIRGNHPPMIQQLLLRLAVITAIIGILLNAAYAGAEPAPSPKPSSTSPDLTETLRQGLFDEEVNNDSAKAAAAYSAVIDQYTSQRAIAATAMFRLAEIKLKQGDKSGAAALYQRVLGEFPENDAVTKPSREKLKSFGVESGEAAAATPQADVPSEEEAKELARVRDQAANSPDLLDSIDTPEKGYTPLSYAASKGWVQVATFLLDHHAKINGPDGGGEPLHEAVAGGHKTLAALLLDRGADVSAATPDGWTALHAAIYLGRDELVHMLLERDANRNAVFIWKGITDHAHGWGNDFMDANALSQWETIPRTPLLMALAHGRPDFVKLLLNGFGADPNLRSGDDGLCRPLLYALATGQEGAARTLLDHGADASYTNDDGFSSLHAAAAGAPSLVPELLGRGMQQTRTRKEEWTPLFNGVVYFDGMARTSNHGAPMPAGEFKGQFALYTEAWKDLLANGADINAEDKEGRNVLFFCSPDAPNDRQIYEWLLANGADINSRDKDGNTPLIAYCATHAPEQTAVDTIGWMVQHGADASAANNKNELPFDHFESSVRARFERQFRFPQLVLSLVKDRGIDAVSSLLTAIRPPVHLAPAADYDAPPSLAALLIRALDHDNLPTHLTVSVHRASGNGEKEIAHLVLDFSTGKVDARAWPSLHWGDAVLFESDDTTSVEYTKQDQWRAALLQQLHNTVVVKMGDRSVTLNVAVPELTNGDMREGRRTAREQYPEMHRGFTAWSPSPDVLPPWTFSSLVLHLVEAEPRANLDGVQISRTVDGVAHTWTIDLRSTDPSNAEPGADGSPSQIKALPERLADGDTITILLAPATDPAVLGARQQVIALASPHRTFTEPVFTREPNGLGGRTLCEFITQAYLHPMLIQAPDLSHIVIHRLAKDGSEQDIPVDLAKIISSFAALPQMQDAGPMNGGDERARNFDIPLQWGDIIELQPLGGSHLPDWTNLDADTQDFLDKALTRKIPVLRSGLGTMVVDMAPRFARFSRGNASFDNLYYGEVTIFGPGMHSEHTAVTKVFGAQTVLGYYLIQSESVRRFTLHLGNKAQAFDGPSLESLNPWIPQGATVEIDESSQ